MAADDGAPACLLEQRASVDTVAGGGGFGVPQEARVDPGVAEGQRLAVDTDGPVLQRPDQVVPTTNQGISIWGHTPEGQSIVDLFAQFKSSARSALHSEDMVSAVAGVGIPDD